MFETKLAFLTFAFFIAGQGSSGSPEDCTLVNSSSDIYSSDACKGVDLSTNGGKMLKIWREVDELGRLAIAFEALQVINESTTSMKLYLQSIAEMKGKTENLNATCEMKVKYFFSYEKDSLHFHPNASSNAKFTNKYLTANIKDTISGSTAIVFSNRHLLPNELFGVHLTKMKADAKNTISIGVTGIHLEDYNRHHKGIDIFTASDLTKAGFWREHVTVNSTSDSEDYVYDLLELKENDTVGVTRKLNGALHLYVNGEDKGAAVIYDEPKNVYGYIDILTDTVEVTILDDGFVE